MALLESYHLPMAPLLSLPFLSLFGLSRIYDEHFSRQYGFWRPYVEQVIYRYLNCGDLHNGFARVKCKD
jgi:hypothetical protein